MKTVAAAVLPVRFDGGGVGAVAQPQHCGEDEKRLDAERLPDPSAEQRDIGFDCWRRENQWALCKNSCFNSGRVNGVFGDKHDKEAKWNDSNG